MSYARAAAEYDNQMPDSAYGPRDEHRNPCANCGEEFEDHWPCMEHEEDSSISGRWHCGIFFCSRDRQGDEFEELTDDEMRDSYRLGEAGL